MFWGKFRCYKNFQHHHPVCILETLARFFSDCNHFGCGGGLVVYFVFFGLLVGWSVCSLFCLWFFVCWLVFLFVFLGSSVILCCSFWGEHHLTPVIYCNGSSSFLLFLSDSAIPFPAIRSNSGYTFPLSLMNWHPVIRKHLANTL